MSGHTPPGSWAGATLSAVASIVRVREMPGNRPELPFIGMDNIEPHSMRLLGTVASSKMNSASVHFFPGDVLYGRLRPYLNKVYVPDFEGLASAEFIPLTAVDGVAAKFIQYRLNAADFVSFASHLDEGDRPRVDAAQIGAFEFELPPTAEQHRIVGAIESYVTRLDNAVASLERVQQNLKRYRASVLKAAVEGRLVPTEAELARAEGRSYEPASALLERILAERRRRWEDAELAKMKAKGKTPKDDKWKAKYVEPVAPDTTELPGLPEGWCWASVDQLAAHSPNALTDGPFGSNLKTGHYTSLGPRVIRLQNIGDGQFVESAAHISEEHFARLRKHSVEAGDVVVASLGIELPRACLVPDWLGPAIVKADCLRFATHPKVIRPLFAVHTLNSAPTRKRAEDLIHGVGRPRIGLSLLRPLPIPVPPIHEQDRILNQVERLLELGDIATASARSETVRLSQLRQSILKWAFEGRLVDQDPSDEPAEHLLERIRTERDAAQTAPSRRPRRVTQSAETE